MLSVRGIAGPAAAAVVLVVALGPAAGAQEFVTDGGGAVVVAKPKVKAVKCVKRCGSRRRAKAGSVLLVKGSGLQQAGAVSFLGTFGDEDDIVVSTRPRSTTRLRVRVPSGAVTGPITVHAGALVSRPGRAVPILPPPPPDPNPTLTPAPGPRQAGAPRLETGTSRTRAYIGSRRTVVLSYRVTGAQPAAIVVEVVRARDGAIVRSWTEPPIALGAVKSLTWNGLGANGRPAARGRYSFRVTAASSSGLIARSAQTPNVTRDAFDLYDAIFPVRGRHDFGGANARFGTGRAGHSHQGHDVFARCGVPMVAARGGRVQFKGFHGAAGNYIVIDGAGTGTDYAYMHLAEPSAFATGDRVYTGQRIGAVGDTGNASGCHLHFELWGAPGWYEGGKPFNPLPTLQAWDSWS